MDECIKVLIDLMKNENKFTQGKIIESFSEAEGERFFKTLITSAAKNFSVVVGILMELN